MRVVQEEEFIKSQQDLEKINASILELETINKTLFESWGKWSKQDASVWHKRRYQIDVLRDRKLYIEDVFKCYHERKWALDDVYDEIASSAPSEDTEEDNLELVKMIRAFDICVIEEPLTCCDELPEEPDLTEQYNKFGDEVFDPYKIIPPTGEQFDLEIDRFPIWSHEQQGIVID